MNNLDKQYQALLKDILSYGVDKNDRTGTGTKSIFGYMIHHNMSEGFPLLTTKKMPLKTIAIELMWFLMGDTNIKYLVENGVHIWDGDAYKAFEKWYEHMSKTTPFEVPRKLTQEELVKAITLDKWHEERFGDLGPIYGKQWRNWGNFFYDNPDPDGDGFRHLKVDQIQNLINDLKTNPDSRRLMVNAWNVGELDQMVLPPCHYGFQMYTRELSLKERVDYGTERGLWKLGQTINYMHCDELNIPTRAISLSWNQRSVDVFLGLPFNIASYGLLLEMIAREVNMVPEHLIGHLGDTHLYLNHLEQAEQQLERIPRELPTLKMSSGHNFRAAMAGKVDEIDVNDFMLIGYNPHPHIKAPLSN
jgi:thymidylate synthase